MMMLKGAYHDLVSKWNNLELEVPRLSDRGLCLSLENTEDPGVPLRRHCCALGCLHTQFENHCTGLSTNNSFSLLNLMSLLDHPHFEENSFGCSHVLQFPPFHL